MPSVVNTFKSHLRESGVSSAMRWLNGTVPHRFSAIFGFDGDTLTNVCLVGKGDPGVTQCPSQPITESYCVYIQRSARQFVVANSLTNKRVDAHPKQAPFHSYYGVPLFSDGGKVLEPVCHFDFAAMRPTAAVAETLDVLALIIVTSAFKPSAPIT